MFKHRMNPHVLDKAMKALKLTIAIIAGKSMAYSYIVLYFYNNRKSSQELVFSSFVHNSQKN